MRTDIRVIIAGGGTGGHLYPALAIGEILKSKGGRVKYMGSHFGIEADYFKKHYEDAVLLNIRGIQRSLSPGGIISNLKFPWRFCCAYLQSKKVIKDFQPDVVVGTGGYSSGLPLLAALRSGIKTLLQEQNSYPGITTRKLSARVDCICIAYEEAAEYLKKKVQFLPGIQFGEISN